jgi:hypothetical protein
MPVMPGLPSTPGAPCLTFSASLAMMELSLQPQTPPAFKNKKKWLPQNMPNYLKVVQSQRSHHSIINRFINRTSHPLQQEKLARSFDQSREEENKLGQSTSQSVE